jgi:tetratricopeptide (TPR) repeat protein
MAMRNVAIDPTQTFNRAIAAYQTGRLGDAEQFCQQILSARPDHFDAAHVLGVVQAALGKNERALASYERALALRPEHADVLSNRGSALLALGRIEEAIASYDRALAVRPDFPEALSNRGSALEKLRRWDEALESYDRALTLRPDYPEALYNRGNVKKALGRFADALADYDRALALRPRHADAHNNRGQVLKEMARYDEALVSYDAALAVQPQHVMARCNAAAVRLLTGDFARGWADYEWRWKKPSVAAKNRNFSQPLWLGAEDLSGKKILLHSEQGAGDTIQFSRYVTLVAARGARVIFEVQKPLQALMADFAGMAQVIARGDPLPAFDLQCPLMSLPLAFGTRLETIPAAPAYLRAPGDRASAWQARFASSRRPVVGLAWSGNPSHERDDERSIALQVLLPLLTAGATFVGLQKDVRAADAAVLRARDDLINVGEELADFSDTAALISQLDLVVSVDTSVAHLAGALGKPVWILLTHMPDFRWLLDRDDSPWYPSARLFRQDQSRAWDGVISRVREALAGAARR